MWGSGRYDRYTSVESALNVSINSAAAASAMKLRWVSNAPLGFPVVPDVLESGGGGGIVVRVAGPLF